MALLLTLALALLWPDASAAQARSMAQDASLNNLQLPPGTVTGAPDTLGRVRKAGTGPRVMLLLPGIGFGDSIWTEFMERHKADYTMYAVSLPGFGDTTPLPIPAGEAPFTDRPWTRSAIRAIEQLLDREKIARVTIVAHWALASQIALQLALDHPDRVEAVVLAAGVLKAYYDTTPGMLEWNSEQRGRYVQALGEKWFKTVTRRTWDDNNFMSYDYSAHPLRGLFLWREAQAPLLAVWIRYMLEFYAFDQTAALKGLRVPVLVVQPTFDDPGFFVDAGRNYMRNLCIDSWRDARTVNALLTFTTIPQSRLFLMHDQVAAFDTILTNFLRSARP